jgi:hypothetical protein
MSEKLPGRLMLMKSFISMIFLNRRVANLFQCSIMIVGMLFVAYVLILGSLKFDNNEKTFLQDIIKRR